MASCTNCDKTILFGGFRESHGRYCSKRCRHQGILLNGIKLPPELVEQQLGALRQSNCPSCKGPGPVDMHHTHTIWSAIYLTSWRSVGHVCCQRCGRKKQLGAALQSMLLGWWGIPWGLIITPVQIAKNISGMRQPAADQPSPALRKHVYMHLANQVYQKQLAAQKPQTLRA